MKKRHAGKIGAGLEAQALRVLRAIPGLTVAAETGRDKGIDAELQFGGRRARVAVEFKTRASAATAWQLVHYAKAHPNMPVVLVANETTTEARSILQANRISLIDGLGNAHVELPGLLIHLSRPTGPPRRLTSTARPRLSGRAGVVAQALLLDRERPWQVQALAQAARASVGLAHRVLARLQREGVVAAEGVGPSRRRRVTDPTALLDLWAEEQVRRPLRTLGYVLGQTPRQVSARIGEGLGRAGIDYALTGAAAATMVAPFVTAVPVTDVWVAAAAAPDDLLRAAHADAVADGHNVVFLQGNDDTPLEFREKRENLWLANHFRLYADLLADPRRGREQAQHLRQEVIGF